MVKEQSHFGMKQYVKIAIIAEGRVFSIFCCPGKLFTKMFRTQTFSTSTGFLMAHYEAKSHEKTIKTFKSNVVKGQMSVIL